MVRAIPHPSQRPEVAAPFYRPDDQMAAFQVVADEAVVLEVYRHGSGACGYRFNAWVAWRDAGNQVRRHGWQLIHPVDSLHAEDLDQALALAQQDARERGLLAAGDWKTGPARNEWPGDIFPRP